MADYEGPIQLLTLTLSEAMADTTTQLEKGRALVIMNADPNDEGHGRTYFGTGANTPAQLIASGRYLPPKSEISSPAPTPSFTGLSDTPSDYTGQAGKMAVVNEDEDGLVFAATPSGSGLPNGGTTGQVLKKASNADGDATWQNESGSGGSSDFNPAPADLGYSGQTITLPSGEVFAAGAMVELNNAGKVVVSTNTTGGPAVFIALDASAAVDTPVKCLKVGIYRNDALFTGLAVGAQLYLGAAGAITDTPPTASGSRVQPVGKMLAAGVMWVDVDSTNTTLA